MERYKMPNRIEDVFTLTGRVSEGVLKRVINLGGIIPLSGPGKHSVPRALQNSTELRVNSVPTTKAGRRQSNVNLHRI